MARTIVVNPNQSEEDNITRAINETNLTAAFWDFLRDTIGDKEYQNPSNKEQAKKQ